MLGVKLIIIISILYIIHFPILHWREKKDIIITIILFLLSYVRGFPSSKTKVYNDFICRKETDFFYVQWLLRPI